MSTKPVSDNDLATSVTSRICHDLVSPVGAIVNGIDLIREIGAPGLGDELGLISQSAERASSVLQFFRLAFGAVDEASEEVARLTVLERARGMIETPRISFGWTGENGPALARRDARIASLALLAVRSMTGRDGLIRIGFDPVSSFPLTIASEGSRASDYDACVALLHGDAAAVAPRSVEFVLLRQVADAAGIRLLVEDLGARFLLRVG